MGYFLYKGITIKNEDSAMKVGTDSLLLGDWLNVLPTDRAILDIGTGTGIIALLAAQKRLLPGSHDTDGWKITALEIDTPSCAEAQFNFDASPWAAHLFACNISLQKYVKLPDCPKGSFDLIFTNPPYFVDKASLKAPSFRRSTARSTGSLTHEEIIDAAFTLLRPGGRLALILPCQEAKNFIRIAQLYHIGRPHLQGRQLRLTQLDEKHPKRIMMEYTLCVLLPA